VDDWSAPHTNANGQQITSPKARFLRKAILAQGDAGAHLVTAAHAAQPPPKITTLTVYPAGTVFQRLFDGRA
jgi:hypothetical protein